MAYNPKELFKQSLEVIKKHKPLFIEEVVSFLPCDKTTFYKYFPVHSNELNKLKQKIEDNKISMKSKLRTKWYESDNATLQMALMKLIANGEEHKRLNQSYTENKHDFKGIDPIKWIDGDSEDK